MSSDLISILERDPALLELLASAPGEPKSLAGFVAKEIMRSRAVDEARRIRREREEAERQVYEERLHRARMAPPGGSPGSITEEGVRELISGSLEALAPLIKDYVEGVVVETGEGLDRRITDLKGVVMGIQQRPHVRYCGVFDLSRRYESGDVVTRHGAMWHANRATVGEAPGNGPSSWTMMNKSQR